MPRSAKEQYVTTLLFKQETTGLKQDRQQSS